MGKFVSLWQNGIEASLHVDGKAGEATVSLQVGLGHAQPLQEQHPLPKSRPSRLRRRQRRAEARKTAEEVAKSDAMAEDTGLKVVDAVTASKSSTVENTVQVPDKVQDDDVAEEAAKNVAEKAKKDTAVPEMVETVSRIVDDEFCSNESYGDNRTTTRTSTTKIIKSL